MKIAFNWEFIDGDRTTHKHQPIKALNRFLLLFSFFVVCSLPNLASAQLANSSWPKVGANLGNTGSSTASGTVGAVKWATQLKGFLRAAPAVGADGNVYLGDDSGSFYSINAGTGVINWTFPIPTKGQLGDNYVDSMPVIDDKGTIYFGTLGGNLFAVSAAGVQTGVWQGPESIAVSPTIGQDGAIYVVTTDGSLTAINPATMSPFWSVNNGVIGNTPAIGSDGSLYLQSGTSLYNLDPKTGATNWSVSLIFGNSEFGSLHPPILTPNAVILTGEFDVVAISLSTQKVLWDFNSNTQDGHALQYSPAVSPDYSKVYIDIQGTCYAIDSGSGAPIWHTAVAVNRDHAGVVIVGGDGTVYDGVDYPGIAALSPAGTILWQLNVYSQDQETTADMSMGMDGAIFISPQSPSGGPGLLRAIWGNTFATLSFSPSSIPGGTGSVGTITLAAMQSSDTIFNVSAPNGAPITGLPAVVKIVQGKLSTTFNVGSTPVSNSVQIPVTASFAFGSTSAPLTVNPPQLTSFVIYTPTGSTVGGTAPVNATVYLNGPPPPGGVNIIVTSDNAAAIVPSPVNVTTNPASFFIQTKPVTMETTAHITATLGTASFTQPLKIEPATLATLSIPTPIVAGSSWNANIYLSGPFPSGTWSINVVSGTTQTLTVSPGIVKITAPSETGTFTVKAGNVTSSKQVKVTASYNGMSISQMVTVNPVTVASVTVSPMTVVGLTKSTATITLNAPATSGGTNVVLTSSNPAVASIQASVDVQYGKPSITVNVNTFAVSSATNVVIFAAAGGVTQTTELTVTPPVITSLTLAPASVKGSASSTGTVKIGSAAPKGGLIVILASSSSYATVPVSVTIPAGQTSATFKVTTKKVGSSSSATITATAPTSSKTVVLTIT